MLESNSSGSSQFTLRFTSDRVVATTLVGSAVIKNKKLLDKNSIEYSLYYILYSL